MNKVTTINLNGNAYQLEENGYDLLREYLENAARRLEGNPDKDEIIADIEQAIADKFRSRLSAVKTVIVTKEVDAVIAAMGPVQDASSAEDKPSPSPNGPASSSDPETEVPPPIHTPKRLYKIKDGKLIGGVCNGLAAYFNIDVTIIRIIWVLLFFTYGFGVLAYILMMIIVPTARTPEEIASACGAPPTAQEFIRRAKAGYYEGIKSFGDKHARREWKRKFKQDMREWKWNFKREMHERAFQGQQQSWASQPPAARAGSLFAQTLLSMLLAALCFVTIIAAISLILTGAVFGVFSLGMPLWLALLLLFLFYRLMACPLKAMRRSYAWPGWHDSAHCSVWSTILWSALIVALICLAGRFVPEVHQTLRHLSHEMDHLVSSLREWWATR